MLPFTHDRTRAILVKSLLAERPTCETLNFDFASAYAITAFGLLTVANATLVHLYIQHSAHDDDQTAFVWSRRNCSLFGSSSSLVFSPSMSVRSTNARSTSARSTSARSMSARSTRKRE